MKQEKYIGHSSQISGVEEYRCLNGKSDGMHVLHIRNGLGMELMINADRCADITHPLLVMWLLIIFPLIPMGLDF
mgnify:CR=1 FL=1